jgi:hypothetical protein
MMYMCRGSAWFATAGSPELGVRYFDPLQILGKTLTF